MLIQEIAIAGTTRTTDPVSGGGNYQYYVTAHNYNGESNPSGTTGARVK